MDEQNVRRFARLFRGNTRSRGVYYPESKGTETLPEELTHEHYCRHLDGEESVGVVPITDDDSCWFGAIDIDAHGEDAEPIDIPALESTVREKDLPLVVCRSKSKGVHLYVFCSEPVPAKLLRKVLANWAEEVGYPGCEVFPKQNRLVVDEDGQRQRGNWINLPWFDVEQTDRWTLESGKQIRFEYFLEIAESRKVSAAELVERGEYSHSEAPPCMQKMIKSGVPHGHRNEALYNLTVYLKRAYPEEFRDRAFDLNARVFEEPLPHSEAKKTVTSAGRRDYQYRCKEEPLRGLCRASLCVKKKYGITQEEKSELELGGAVDFQRLVKIESDPPKWLLYIDGQHLTLSSVELMDHRQVRIKALETMSRMLPVMKNDQWQMKVHNLLKDLEVVEAPEEASAKGIIRAHLQEFVARTDLSRDGTNRDDRADLLHGMPVVQYHEKSGERFVYFRGPDLVEYLRRQRAEEAKHSNLWVILREIGVTHTRLRVPGKSGPVPVWCLRVDEEDGVDLPEVDVEPEF